MHRMSEKESWLASKVYPVLKLKPKPEPMLKPDQLLKLLIRLN
jgi:hypothetical protein